MFYFSKLVLVCPLDAIHAFVVMMFSFNGLFI